MEQAVPEFWLLKNKIHREQGCLQKKKKRKYQLLSLLNYDRKQDGVKSQMLCCYVS